MRGLRGRVARGAARDDRGQTSVEFLGILPLILLVLIVLWQCALVGYTYTLAGNAADKAAREATSADVWQESRQQACERGGEEDLGASWRTSAVIQCWTEPGLVRSEVRLKVPALFPGTVDFPFDVTGDAAAAKES